MSIKKKNRRKKRQPQTVEAPPTEESGKVQYQDDFQANIGNKIEELGSKLEGKGRNLLYGMAALAVLAVLVGIFYTWNRRTNNAAQAALGKAIETSQAFVTDSPIPAGSTIKTFKTERARAEAAIKEFQLVAETYGSPHKEKAEYFIAVNRFQIDRTAAVKDLERLAAGTGETAVLSKFALAQAKTASGKLDEAARLYEQLKALDDTVLAKDTISFELARIYEKQDKIKPAADIYFTIVKTATELKDKENNPVPLSPTALEARDKLNQLAPERAKEIKDPEPPPIG